MRPLMRRLLPGNRGLGRDGITLVEVLAAMTILALGLLALLPMAVTSISANEHARDTRGAMELIQNRIEAMRLADSLTSGTQYDSASGQYSHWWSEDVSTNLKKLVVEVTWTGAGHTEHTQRGSAYLYKKE